MPLVRPDPLPAFIFLYAAMYAAFGVASPFWPRFFEWRGLPPEQIGLLLGLGTMIRLVAGPLAGRIADLLGALRAVLATCTALAVCMALGLLAAEGFWPLLAIHLGQAAALAPTTTLADALALHAAKGSARHPAFEYGWVRGAASAAFIVGTLFAGQVLGIMELSAVVWMHAALLAGAVLATGMVPGFRARTAHEPHPRPTVLAGWRELSRVGVFRRLVLVAALVYGSHAMHDSFAVIRWNAAGIGAEAISVLWSEAVAAEVLVFFLIGPALVHRIGPNGAAVLAALAGVVRWVVMAATTAPAALALVQPLHGFTFALLHLACMRLIVVVVPVRLAASAQALYALGAGLASALLVLPSGYLYAEFGAQAFLLMALLCAVAIVPARKLTAPAAGVNSR